MKVDISIIIPVFNEEVNIPILYKRLSKTLAAITSSYELIFINDGSTDNSLKKLLVLRKNDKKVKILSFSRNFGHMSAVNAGIIFAKGMKVVLIDADLQDPPEVIAKMYKKSLKGFEVVYGIKTNRKEQKWKVFLFTQFYVLLNKLSSYKMPLDAGTFSLMDKKVVDVLKALPEKNKYFSGLRAWSGFSQTGVSYERAERTFGKASSLTKLVRLALNGIFSFSYIPLRLASIFGFMCAAVSLIGIGVVVIARLFFNAGFVGWASTMTTILLMSGVQLITLGIIGEYLGRIYDEVKGRPEYIIAKKYGIKK